MPMQVHSNRRKGLRTVQVLIGYRTGRREQGAVKQTHGLCQCAIGNEFLRERKIMELLFFFCLILNGLTTVRDVNL